MSEPTEGIASSRRDVETMPLRELLQGPYGPEEQRLVEEEITRSSEVETTYWPDYTRSKE